MDLPSLASRVRASLLLNDEEKTYWFAHLPQMKPEQLTKLETILAEAEKLAATK